MRIFCSLCGVLALVLGTLTLWLNTWGGFIRSERLCQAGFCDEAPLRQEARLATLAEGGGQGRMTLRVQEALLRRDAASPLTWIGAAFAYEGAGDRTKARYCAARAFELGSGSAPLLMRVLHFYLSDNSREDVLRTGRALLALVRDYDDFVFRYYDAVATNAEVLDRGLPRESPAAFAFLWNRIAGADVEGATQTWNWMKRHALVTTQAVNGYCAFLMEHKEVEASRQAWDEFHARDRARHPNNLIYNPDFEGEVLKGGNAWLAKGPYEWNIGEIAGAAVTLDREARDGGTSLKIEFQGETNIDFQHVRQIIPVSHRPLRLKAMVKCAGLTTNEGVAIRVFDREAPARFSFTTGQLTGTADWTQWDYPLSLPAQTRLLELQIVRQRSEKFDNKIKGAAWFSGLSLEPVAK